MQNALMNPVSLKNANCVHLYNTSNNPAGPSYCTVAYTSGALTTPMTVSFPSMAGTGILTPQFT